MRRIWIAALLVLLLALPARAAGQAELYGADGLRDGLDARTDTLLEDVDPTRAGDFSGAMRAVVRDALHSLPDAVKSAARALSVLLAILLFCALAGNVEGGVSRQAAALAGALAVTGACTVNLQAMIALARETISQVSAFSELLLPVLSSVIAASGAATSAGVLYAGSALFMNVLLTLITRLLIPLVYAFCALAAAQCATGEALLARLRELLGWIISVSLKGVMYVFTAYLTVSGIVSGTADAAGVKAAKAAFSAALPVVGGIVSDATESVLAGAQALKASVGAFGLLALLAMGLLPFLRIALQYLALKVAAAAGGLTGEDRLPALLGHLSTAMGYMLAMTGCGVLMAMFCCCCFMKAAGG